MSFLISKMAGFLLLPSNFIAFVGIVEPLRLLVGRRRAGAALLAQDLGRAAPAASDRRSRLRHHHAWRRRQYAHNHGSGTPALNDAGERITAVAAFAREHPGAHILLSGGASDFTAAEPITESAIAKNLLN